MYISASTDFLVKSLAENTLANHHMYNKGTKDIHLGLTFA